MDKIYTDIAIIGGGASGLAAGIHAALNENKFSVVILESGERVGKKLLSTGNGRCNLSHIEIINNLAKNYYGEKELARKIFSKANTAEQFFSSLGMLCRIDGEGRIYPYSNTATGVLGSLRDNLIQLGVKEICEFKVKRLDPLFEGYNIYSDEKDQPIVSARRVIFATGGKSQPSSGSDGSGLEILQNMGIRIEDLHPSLCPLKTGSPIIKSLKNLRIKAKLTAEINDKSICEETGEIQFSENSLSGISVFNVSHLAFGLKKHEQLTLSLDLIPEMGFDQLQVYLTDCVKWKNSLPLTELLIGLFPKRVGEVLIRQIYSDSLTREIGTLTADNIKALTQLIKHWKFPIEKYEEIPKSLWQSSQVTRGGVVYEELTGDLSLKKHPHIFLAGEMINVSGKCGGYNLAWAWASAQVSADSAVKSLTASRRRQKSPASKAVDFHKVGVKSPTSN